MGTNIGNLFKAGTRAYDTPNYQEMAFLEGRFQQENQQKLSSYDDYVSAVTNLTDMALDQARNNKPIDVPQYYKNTFGTNAESEFKKDVNKLNKERNLTTSFGNAAVSPEYIAKFLGPQQFTNFLNDVDLSRNVLGNGKKFNPVLSSVKTFTDEDGNFKLSFSPQVDTFEADGQGRSTAMTADGGNVSEYATDEEREAQTVREFDFDGINAAARKWYRNISAKANINQDIGRTVPMGSFGSFDEEFDTIISADNPDRAGKAAYIENLGAQEKERIRLQNEETQSNMQKAQAARDQRAAVEEFKAEEAAAGRPFGVADTSKNVTSANIASAGGAFAKEDGTLPYEDELKSIIDDIRGLYVSTISQGGKGAIPKFTQQLDGLKGTKRQREAALERIDNSEFANYRNTVPDSKNPFGMNEAQLAGSGYTVEQAAEIEQDLLAAVKENRQASIKESIENAKGNQDPKTISQVRQFYQTNSLEEIEKNISARPDLQAEFDADPFAFAVKYKDNMNEIKGLPKTGEDKEAIEVVDNWLASTGEEDKITRMIDNGDVEGFRQMLIQEEITPPSTNDQNIVVNNHERRNGNFGRYGNKANARNLTFYLASLPSTHPAWQKLNFTSLAEYITTGQWSHIDQKMAIAERETAVKEDTADTARMNAITSQARVALDTAIQNGQTPKSQVALQKAKFDLLTAQYNQAEKNSQGTNRMGTFATNVTNILQAGSGYTDPNDVISNAGSKSAVALDAELANIAPYIETLQNAGFNKLTPAEQTDYRTYQITQLNLAGTILNELAGERSWWLNFFTDPQGSEDEGLIDKVINSWANPQPGRGLFSVAPNINFIDANGREVRLDSDEYIATLPNGQKVFTPAAEKEALRLARNTRLEVGIQNGTQTVSGRDIFQNLDTKYLPNLILLANEKYLQ